MIRLANVKDKDQVIRLLEESRIEAGFHTDAQFSFPFVREYAERLFVHHLYHGLALVAEIEDAGVQGVLLAICHDHPFGPVRMARETLWFINAQHRGGSTARRMLKYYEQWAKSQGCEFIGMAGMGSEPAVGSMYERADFKVAETFYIKNLQ